MAELFIAAFLGHLIGDFLLQSKDMALNKSKPGLPGVLKCTGHVLIYSVTVCGMLALEKPDTFGLLIFAMVFVPHWIIDRYSLANHWLRVIGGRTFEGAFTSPRRYREFDISFTAVVYTVTDNTMHLLCLWLMIKFYVL